MRLLVNADDVNAHLLVLAVNCVEDWFPEGPIPLDDYVDRLCHDYLNAEGFDIENLDTPAVRKIMRAAREAQRQMA